jgi:uncharacterized protein with PIN domain
MLGKLCKWLRIFGFDVEYTSPDMTDNEILEKCRQGDLWLITRDKGFKGRYGKLVLISAPNIDQQLKEFLSRFPPDSEKFFSRCPVCNRILVPRDSRELVGLVPEKIIDLHKEIDWCETCGKGYWKGSHYDKMVAYMKTVIAEDMNADSR